MSTKVSERQKELYANLLDLCASTESFFYKDNPITDCDLDTRIYRVFSYRLPSYTDFCRPDALECRGHTFEIDSEGNMIRLAALPPAKFFNNAENPMVMNLDFTGARQIMFKMDGSLISSLTHYGRLKLKSKMSFCSQQVLDAMDWINLPKNLAFKSELERLSSVHGITVNMEWISPTNRIVIGYQESKLVVLNARDNWDGAYVTDEWMLENGFVETYSRWVERVSVEDANEFVKSVDRMTGIEGFVIELANGTFVKVKTDAYRSLHKTKDSITTPRRLFECILDQAADELRSLFHDDQFSLSLIRDMEDRVSKIYNHLVARVENFFSENRTLERKEYAIKGQKELNGMEFPLAMQKFLGKEVNYSEFLKGKWKDLGIKDEKIVQESEE